MLPQLKRSFVLIIALSAITTGFAQNGPGGVGFSDGSSSLHLWLTPDSVFQTVSGSSSSNGDPVGEWRDKSGYDHSPIQSGASRPSFSTSSINGNPAVEFVGNGDFMEYDFATPGNTDFIDGVSGLTFFIVVASDLIGTDRGFFDTRDPDGGDNQFAVRYDDAGASSTRDDVIKVGISTTSGSQQFESSALIQDNANPQLLVIDWAAGADLRLFEDDMTDGVATFGTSNLGGAIQGSTKIIIGQGPKDNVAGQSWDGSIGEVILYTERLNAAQRIMVQNYLASRFSLSIGALDFYAHESTHPTDIAGIGRSGSDYHVTANSSSLLQLDTTGASSMTDGHFLMIGHDNGATSWSASELPASAFGGFQRISREWKIDESADFGNIRILLDTTTLDDRPSGYTKFVLLVDDDGDFSNATTYEMTSVGDDNIYQVDLDPADGAYFSFGSLNPTLGFSATTLDSLESGDIQVILALNYLPVSNVQFDLSTSDVTATGIGSLPFNTGSAVEDYLSIPTTTVIFNGGVQQDTTFTIDVNQDTQLESSESFTVNVTNITAGINTNAPLTARINDDDNPRKIFFNSATSSVNEFGTSIDITVGITPALVDPTNPTTVQYQVSGGTATNTTDYTVLGGGMLTIPATFVSANFTVNIADDAIDEIDETVVISLFNPSNSSLSATNPIDHTLTILDNDPSTLIEFNSATSSNPESIASPALTVILSALKASDATVDYAISGNSTAGQDFNLAAGTLTIPAGQISGTITPVIIDDAISESDETLVLTLSNPVGADLGSVNTHTYTITDNDAEFGFTGPGGVGSIDGTSALSLWLKADAGTKQVDGVTDAGFNNPVAQWEDQSGYVNDFDQITAGQNPILRPNAINGENALEFDGTDDVLEDTDGEAYINGISAYSLVAVIQSDIIGTDKGFFDTENPDGADDALALRYDDGGLNSGRDDVIKFGINNGTDAQQLESEANDQTTSPQIMVADWASGNDVRLFINGALKNAQVDGPSVTGTLAGADRVLVGTGPKQNDPGINTWDGMVGEIMMFTTRINTAQRTIFENYLAAKYGITISNDFYAYEATHGEFVAGIGQASADEFHDDAQSDGILRMNNPSALEVGDYLFFGHDSTAIDTWTSTERPVDSLLRIQREWVLDQTTYNGTIDVILTDPTTTLGALPADAQGYVLLVDDDGDFANGGTDIYNMTASGSDYVYQGLNISADRYLTFATNTITAFMQVSSASISESGASYDITVNLSRASASNTDVAFRINGSGTATQGGGNDYTIVASPFTIGSGLTSDVITITVNNDVIVELDETIIVELDNATNNVAIRADSVFTLTIQDEDALSQGSTGPGGVKRASSYEAWWKADSAVFSDAGTTPAVDGGIVTQWNDLTGSANIHHASVFTATDEPLYNLTTGLVNGKPAIDFSGADSALTVSNETGLNSATFLAKTVAVSFETSADVSTRQVVYEQGGGTQGLNVFIESNQLKVAVWDNDWTDVTSGYYEFTSSANINTTYAVVLQFRGGSQTILCTINGVEQAPFTIAAAAGANLDSHGGDVGIGGKINTTRYSSGSAPGGEGDFFSGKIMEVINMNDSLNSAERIVLENYLSGLYDVNISGGNDYFAHKSTHGYDVIGIGQTGGEFHVASTSDSLLVISNANDLANDEFLFMGHDNADENSFVATNVPNSNIQRLSRSWRVSETGDVGTLRVTLRLPDLGATPGAEFTQYALLVDEDGDFSAGTSLHTFYAAGGNRALDINLVDGDYLAIAAFRPTIQFAPAITNGDESVTAVQAIARLTYPINGAASVNYSLDGGNTTATQGMGPTDDFDFPAGLLQIASGDSTAILDITINDDASIESNETITIDLSGPSAGLFIGNDTTFTYTIQDDDQPVRVEFTVSRDTVSEGNGSYNMTIRLNQTSGSDVNVDYAVSGGTASGSTDYALANGTATISAGGFTTSILIGLTDDTSFEAFETLVVQLSNPVNASLNAKDEFTLVLEDNDPLPEINFSLASQSGSESQTAPNLGVSLSNVAGVDASVDYEVVLANSTASGMDYTLASGVLTITNGSTSGSISLSIVNDSDIEVDETVEVRLYDNGNLTNATLGATDTLVYTILDNDAGGFVGPGGVGLPMDYVVWLRADKRVERDSLAGTAATNGSIVQRWIDYSGNGNNAKGSSSNEPTYLLNAINGKPSVDFGSTNFAASIDNSANINDGGGPYNTRSILVAFQAGSDVGTQQVIYEEGGGGNGFAIYVENDSVFVAGWADGATTPWSFDTVGTGIMSGQTMLALLEFDFNDGGRLTGYFNADSIGSKLGKPAGMPDHGGGISIGGSADGWELGSGDMFGGQIMELLLFNGTFSNTDRIIVENYLGAKYGISLATSGNDFYAYDVSHGFDVIGIGRQTSTDFHTKSQSDSLVTISNAADLGDGEYLFVGHDNGLMTSYVNTDVPGSNLERLQREWRVSETGEVGSVLVSIDTTRISATPTTGFTEFMLMVDADGLFASGATLYPMTRSGSQYQATVSLQSGDYFTLALVRPEVQFTNATSNAGEDIPNALIGLSLNYALAEDISFTVNETGAGTATEGADFTYTDGIQSITAGNTSVNVTIDITNDAQLENDESVQLQVLSPSIGAIGANGTHLHTINDDDNFRKANFQKADSTNTEDQAPIQIGVFLNARNDAGTTSIFYAVTGGSALNDSTDYFVQAVDTLVYAIGDTLEFIDINVIDDIIDENDETVIISLTGGSSATIGDTTIFTYTIQDNDLAPTIQFSTATRSGAESAQTVDLAIELSAVSGKDVIVPFSSTDVSTTVNDDYQLPFSSVTILAGQATDSIQFLVLNDGLNEANEQVQIDLGTPTNATASGNTSLTYTILDDDGLAFSGPGGVGNLDEQIALWLRATDPGFGLSNGDPITNIQDRTNNSNNGFQATGSAQPQYLTNSWNGRPVFALDGDDLIQINDTDAINTGGPYDQKTIMVAFRTSTDVTTRQMIYEEGGGVRGLSIYIDAGQLYIGGWNNNDDDGGATTPWPSPGPPTNNTVFTTRPVLANSNNFLFLQFNFLAGSGTVDGNVSAALNGENLVEVSGAGRLFAHPADIGIGGLNDGTVVHDGNEGIVENYNGNLGEVVVQNLVYNPAQFVIVSNYLSSKYNVPLTTVSDVFAYDENPNNYGYEVFGIGQVRDSAHADAQGHGIVRINNPQDLNNDEFMLFGHDNGNISAWTSTGVPDGDTDNFRILARTWRADDTGDVGNIDLLLDASSLPSPPVGFTPNYVVLVDDDPDFSTDATVYQLTSNSGYFGLSNLDIPTDGYFTFGLANTVIGFTSTFTDGPEDVSPANVQVGLNYITQSAITVDVDSTINSSAQPADFSLVSNTVTISAGNQTANVQLNLTNDSEEESSETIQLALSNPSIGSLTSMDTTIFSINDDDIARTIQFVLTDSTGNEADSPASIRVYADSLSAAEELRVYYQVTGGTATSGEDFVLTADTLRWGLHATDPNDTIRLISLVIAPDMIDEPLETIEITISSPQQAGLGANTVFTYSITDDDIPPTIDWQVASSSGPEPTTTVNAILSLSAASAQDITVNYSDQSSDPPTPGGIDYDLQGTSFVIPAGRTQDTLQFSVFDDAIAGEGAESVVIRLDGATNATANVGSLFTYTIIDDDGGFGPLGPGGVGGANEMAFWLRADSAVFSDLGTTPAMNGVNIQQWNDLGGNGNNAVDATVGPALDSIPSWEASVSSAANRPGLLFQATNFEHLTIPDNNLINDNAGDYTLKSIALVFETGASDPPTENQIIFEQGGGGNGLNIFFGTDGDLHFGAWSTGSSPSWGYTEVTAPIGANELAQAIFEIDAANGNLNVYLNGDAVRTASTGVSSVLNSHGGDVGIGGMKNDSRFSSGTVSGEGNFFEGRIFEIVEYNERNLTEPARRVAQNYFAAKYGIGIGPLDNYAYEAQYADELFGIGTQGGTIHGISKGSGILKLDNPASIDNGDYLLIGHDGGSISNYSTTNTPPDFANTFMERVDRTWRVDETGDFGNVRLSVDTTQLPNFSAGFSDLFLLVSSVPSFSSYDTLIRFSETFATELRATFDFTAGQFFTLAIAQNVSAQSGAWDDPNTWVIGVPTVDEIAYVTDSVYLTADVSASVVVALDNIAGRGKLNLGSHSLSVSDSLIILGFGPPNRDSTTFTANTGTVNYGGANTEIFIQPLVYYNLTLSGTGRRHLKSETQIHNDFTIDDNPELVTNNNNLQIRGNWNSAINSTFTPGTGTVTFNGSGPQSISPTNRRVTFNNLIVDNPGGDITLGDSVEVTGILTLTQNDIILGSECLIINNSAPGAIVCPGDNTSYIQADGGGSVERAVAQGNSYVYPIGDASGNYTPFTFEPTNLSGSTPMLELSITDARATDVAEEFAHITRSWTFEPTGVSSATFDITMQYDDTDVVGDESMLVPLKFNVDADTSDFPDFTLDVVNNTIVWRNLTSFSTGSAGVNKVVLVPVEFLYFEGEIVDGLSELSWATATEISNDRFEVEWSRDGRSFEKIGEVAGSGDSEEVINYSFTDFNPVLGVNYYRLKQVDFDGRFDYSRILRLENGEDDVVEMMVTIFPNPAPADNINLRFERVDRERYLVIKLTDLMGRLKLEQEWRVDRYSNEVRLSPRNVSSGLYLLSIDDGFSQKNLKVFVK